MIINYEIINVSNNLYKQIILYFLLINIKDPNIENLNYK